MNQLIRSAKIDMLEARSREGSLSDHDTLLLVLAIERSGFRKGQKRWTNGDDRRLQAYLKRGKKPAHIAPLMGRTERAIWRRMTIKGWSVAALCPAHITTPSRLRAKCSIARISVQRENG